MRGMKNANVFAARSRVAAARPPPSKSRLHCLGWPHLDALGQAIALDPRWRAQPVELLLRVAAAGPGGIALSRLLSLLWPTDGPRLAQRQLEDCRRCLALLLGTDTPPVAIDGDLVKIDERVLAVDAFELERALEPLLDPFRPATSVQAAGARALLGEALAVESIFLPDFDAAWADAARRRIADAVARAARQLTSGFAAQGETT